MQQDPWPCRASSHPLGREDQGRHGAPGWPLAQPLCRLSGRSVAHQNTNTRAFQNLLHHPKCLVRPRSPPAPPAGKDPESRCFPTPPGWQPSARDRLGSCERGTAQALPTRSEGAGRLHWCPQVPAPGPTPPARELPNPMLMWGVGADPRCVLTPRPLEHCCGQPTAPCRPASRALSPPKATAAICQPTSASLPQAPVAAGAP